MAKPGDPIVKSGAYWLRFEGEQQAAKGHVELEIKNPAFHDPKNEATFTVVNPKLGTLILDDDTAQWLAAILSEAVAWRKSRLVADPELGVRRGD
jgi:hypothetical protein